MQVVGLTGGIGSGKTTVLELFKAKGIPCYISDLEAKRLMVESTVIRNHVTMLFGEESYADNKLNTSYLAQIVFSDKEKLEALNKIVHPVVKEDFQRFVKNQNTPYVIYESAVLLNNGIPDYIDKVISVIAEESLRIDRVVARDNVKKEDVKKRISRQLSQDELIKNADFIIENNNLSFSELENNVNLIHKQLMSI